MTEMEPVPFIKDPCKSKEHLSLEQLLSSVQSWFDQGAPGRLCVRGMDLEDFHDLFWKLRHIEIKLRFDWDSESRTAITRVPARLTEVAKEWFGYPCANHINRKLAQVAICGSPSVTSMGARQLPVGTPKEGEVSSVMPDQSMCLVQRDEEGEEIFIPRIGVPRVVFEAWESEYGYHMIDKVFKYLYETGSVNAVILCTMTNAPLPVFRKAKPGAQPAKPFKAEISVWTRKADDLGHHLDPCYHREELGDHKVGDSLRSVNRPDYEQDHAGESASSLVPGEFNDRAREYFRPDPNNPGQEQRIYRRSPSIVLYDESAPVKHGEPQQELMLDVYDFLRPCSHFPDHYIRDRNIAIPLKGLRRSLELEIEYERNWTRPHPGAGCPTNSLCSS